jgi:hypothetical protein
MRPLALILCAAALAGCTSGVTRAPSDAIFYEVVPPAPPPPPAAPTAGRDDFTSRIERAIAEPGAAQVAGTGTVSLPPLPVAPSPPAAGVLPVTVAGAGSGSGVAVAPAPSAGLGTGAGAGVAVPPGAAGTPLDDDQLNLNLYTLEQQRIDAAIAERELEEARQQLVIVQPGAVPQAVEGVNIALYAQQTTNRVGERRFQRPMVSFGSGSACRRYATPDQAQRAFLAAGGPERDPYNLDPDGDGFACDWNPEPFRRLGS